MNKHLDIPADLTTGTLILRAQHGPDVEALHALVPHDQVAVFDAAYGEDGNSLVFTRRVAEKPDPEQAERAKLAAMTEKDIKTLAARRGVAWDKQASRETMLDRLLEVRSEPTSSSSPMTNSATSSRAGTKPSSSPGTSSTAATTATATGGR